MRALAFIILLLCLGTHAVQAQKEGNIWYFGRYAGVDFNKGSPPAILTNGMISTNEGCASVSNRFGQLLFYTDGLFLYNRLHKLMPNGDELMGNISSTQSAVIVPFPNDSSRYYIFTVDAEGGPNGLRYSIVDMKLNNGYGDIDTMAKNIPLLTPTCEKIAVMRISGKNEYWVVTQGKFGSTFFAWKITNKGLSPNPVMSTAGRYEPYYGSLIGYLKFNRTGTRLASCYYMDTVFDILNFDDKTGKVSNTITINDVPSSYGCEFSPNGQYLYISSLVKRGVLQYDITGTTAAAIKATKYEMEADVNQFGALQIGPDGIIYVSVVSKYLSAILHPDKKEDSAGYVINYVSVDGCVYGLPTMPSSLFDCPQVNLGKDTALCTGQRLVLKYYIPGATYRWQDGSTEDSFIVSKAGEYSIACTYNNCISYDTINISFKDIFAAFSKSDTMMCEGTEFSFTYPDSSQFLTWSNGSHSRNFSTTKSGKVWVKSQISGCERTDTLNIIFAPPIQLSLKDTIICRGETYSVQLPFPYPVKWQDGSMTRHYNINHSGEYRLVVYDICGTKEYNFKVSYFPEEPLHLPLDTAFCEDDTVRIFAGNANSFFNYRWNDGSSSNYLDITHSGTYTVTKTGPCGSSAAQMNVSKNICNCPAYYPNVFTPDDNHINEVWKPLVCPTSNWHLQIYNRWGELIWETFDQQQGWDGRFGGVICMDGLYVFRNSYKTPWGEINYHRGSFYLTR